MLCKIYKNKKRKIGKVSFEIVTGDFKEEIFKFTNSEEVDILVMATHKRSLLQGLFQKNTTIDIVNEIQVPLLILKID
ncbi:MAG: universal stress protein [Saprospiraceae bacterium]